MLSSHPIIQEQPSHLLLNELRTLLATVTGSCEAFSHHSIQHLIISSWYEDHELATLATLTLAKTDAPLDYSALPEVLM
jgi:hypothetical protein